jgi:glycosyltransferase involved in cell wall biosynthesis
VDKRRDPPENRPLRIAHLTSAHSRNDVRVFLKECRSLAKLGHEVTLVVIDGRGSSSVDGVRVVDAGRRAGHRLGRIISGAARVFIAARRLRADVYHIHDPELIPWGLLLRAEGARVIYDAHEHVPEDILSKHYLPAQLVKPLASVLGAFELGAAKRMSGVIAATPHIADRFRAHCATVEGIYNFPLTDELARAAPWEARARQACYVGGVSLNRGIREVAQAARLCRAKVVVAGPLWDGLDSLKVEEIPGWSNLCYVGQLPREKVADVMAQSRVGVVTFLAIQSHRNALPNKLFEYMSAGIPVVASNFPLWREIVDETGSGLCVDPSDPEAIAAAIDELVENETLARQCSANGIQAVAEKFNWSTQERKLSRLYDRVVWGDRACE